MSDKANNVYTVGEFRKNMKEALDKADKDQTIIIQRGSKVYILKVPMNPEAYR